MKTKREILESIAHSKDERMLLAGLLDKEQACEQRGYLTGTKFLSMGEHALCVEALRMAEAVHHSVFWGGYAEAERGIFLFFPEYMDAETAKNASPLTLLRAHKCKDSTLTHRDYLGGLMGLQIDRALIGDVLVHDEGADILVLEEAADFIQLNFTQAGNSKLSVTHEPLDTLIIGEELQKEGFGFIASPRLDSIVALIFSLSRNETQRRISDGIVFVNSLPCKKPERLLDEGDRITVRHHGRARIVKFGGHSRKGRLFIQFVKTI